MGVDTLEDICADYADKAAELRRTRERMSIPSEVDTTLALSPAADG